MYVDSERREKREFYKYGKEQDIMEKKYVMALDAGTTSNRAIIF